MKNLTITLEDAVEARAQAEAAKVGKSLSRFVSDLVDRSLGRETDDSAVVEAFLAGPSLPLTCNGRAPTTDQMYE